MSNPLQRDFIQGKFSKGRNFQQAFSRDRNLGPGNIIKNAFTYSGGWQATLSVSDTGPGPEGNYGFWDIQGYEFAGRGFSSVPLNQQSVNPTSTLPALSVSAIDAAGKFDPTLTSWGYYFHKGASTMLQWIDLILPGTYQIHLSDGGNFHTFGTVNIYANQGGNRILLASFPAIGDNIPHSVNVTFDSKARFGNNLPFSIAADQLSMDGDFSNLHWESYSESFLGVRTVLDSGIGIPPADIYWGENKGVVDVQQLSLVVARPGPPIYFWIVTGTKIA